MQTVTLETFERAMIYAIQKHSGVTRKGVDAVGFRRPYILHPLSVMQRIFNNKVSKNIYLLACAALLHDVVEDCFENRQEGLAEIAKLFGYSIAAIVDELTLDKEKYKLIGKKEYLAQELNIMSSYALAIKLCDRLDNVSDLATMPEDFRNNYVAETEYILGNLNRKLSDMHRKLVAEIYLTIEQYKIAA